MFGNRLIRETGGVAFQDPNFRTDLVNFIHNCTMYDLIDGTVDPGTFSSSDDVWALMASPNPARFTTLTSAGGSITVDTCPNAYTNLNGRLPAQLTRIQGKLAFQLNPTLPAAAANAAIAGQIQQAYLLWLRFGRDEGSLSGWVQPERVESVVEVGSARSQRPSGTRIVALSSSSARSSLSRSTSRRRFSRGGRRRTRSVEWNRAGKSAAMMMSPEERRAHAFDRGSTSVMLPGHVCSTNSCTADAVSRTELDWRNSNKS